MHQSCSYGIRFLEMLSFLLWTEFEDLVSKQLTVVGEELHMVACVDTVGNYFQVQICGVCVCVCVCVCIFPVGTSIYLLCAK